MPRCHVASVTRSFVLTAALAFFAEVGQAQTFTYQFEGTIITAASVAAPWIGANPGNPFSVVIEVDSSASPSPLPPSQVLYDAILSTSVTIGSNTVSDGSSAGPDLVVGNNAFGFPECEDVINFIPAATPGWDTELTLRFDDSEAFPACPETVASLDIPLSIDPLAFDSSSFRLRNSVGGMTDIRGLITSVSIVVTGNDDCADAVALPSFFAITEYDATGATTDGVDATGFCDYGPLGDEQNHNDIWFTYTPDVGGCTYISTFGLTDFETRLTVYEGYACRDDAAQIIACADYELQPPTAPGEAGLDVELVANALYTIRLGMHGTSGFAFPAGAGALRIAQGPGADINSGGNNPGAPGCSPFPSLCNGNGGDQMGCSDCPCMNNADPGFIGGCLNSSGKGSRLIASGDPSVSLPFASSDDLRFEATSGPANQLFILNTGDALAPGDPANPCFGTGSGVGGPAFDGLRCAIMNTLRNGGRGADSNGEVGVTNPGWGGADNPPGGIAQFFGYASGSTRYFQGIHRDTTAVNCGTGLNTTQAIEVTFTP